MSAEVFDFYSHQAVCLDCNWEGTLQENQDACQQEADDHNTLHHRGQA